MKKVILGATGSIGQNTLKILRSNKKDFESYIIFRNWANTLLNDINDVDMAMAENADVFNDLYEIQKLQSITDEKVQTALNFWKIIPKIISEFKSQLNKNNMATKGICHVNAKDNIDIFSQANKDLTRTLELFIFLVKLIRLHCEIKDLIFIHQITVLGRICPAP